MSIMNAPADIDKQLVRRHFSTHAEDYDRYARVQKTVIEKLVSTLPAILPVGAFLDIGTGTGLLAGAIQQRYPLLRPLVCDLAHGMTLHASRRHPARKAFDADAQCLPLRNDCCQLVVSSSVFQWLENLAVAFAEAGRLLLPGGRFAFALFGSRSLYELRSSHPVAVAECGDGRDSHVQTYPSLSEVRQALQGTGLIIETLWVEEMVETHPDVATLLRALKRIGAGNASTRRPPGLAARKVMLRMMDHYTREFGREGFIPATYEVVFAVARRPWP